MSDEEQDLVSRLHREEAERIRQQKAKERALVEALFEQALQRQRAEGKQAGSDPAPVAQSRGIPYTELAEATPGEPLAEEWNTYRREVGRLLAEGHEGRHVLIKGEEIIGIFQTSAAASEAGWKRYLGEPFFVHPIRTEEPFLRIRGVNFPWPSSLSR